ncbi:MAG: hypothetical protein F6K35_24785 [Okeania sp. SIO2H7]|nr:hypothetical protein [Okeania sp. SIO2H7]
MLLFTIVKIWVLNMYYPTVPDSSIYKLILVTTVFAVIWGLIFKDMLEYQLAFWNANRNSQKQINYQKPQIIVAYLGTTFFTFICIGAGLSTFLIGNLIAYILGAIVVFPTALFIWLQLGSMLILLAEGGSAAISIEEYLPGEKVEEKPAETADNQ